MKKIIKNKLYDTDTATLVGHWDKDLSVTDCGWYSEDLYRKRTGEYFIYGEGNAASPYRQRSYDMWAAGEQIVPIGYDEAREWAEYHLEVEEYEAEFGLPDEGDGDEVVSARVSAAAKRALKRESQRTCESQAAILERLLMTLTGE